LRLKAGEKYVATVLASDYENDPITYKWEVLPESTDLGMGGDYESRPETLLSMEVSEAEIELEAPKNPGAYRLFVYATDDGNRSATANIPFFIEE
ncbi:MAG: hypothetical protein IMY68_04995, partial [Bacteroidetes bacterium]|nr:hypothetical protein [Bacteroidota bacterium]